MTDNYEHEVKEVLGKYLKDSDVFWDIGCSNGDYSGWAGCVVKKVIAFDPKSSVGTTDLEPTNSKQDIYKVAISSFNGNAIISNLTIGSDNEGISVPVTTIDYLVSKKGFEPPTIMKIDIEGQEVEAIKGGINTIAKHHPIIMLECHSWKVTGEYKNEWQIGDNLWGKVTMFELEQLGYKFTPLNDGYHVLCEWK